MVIFLYILCAISFINGLNVSINAETVMQQIVSSLSFVAASILLVGGTIVFELQKREVKEQKPEEKKTTVLTTEKITEKIDDSILKFQNFENLPLKVRVFIGLIIIVLTILVGFILRANILRGH